jgi:hypothetical protein
MMQIAGVIYSEERKKSQARYQEAVKRAHFLEEKEKRHWALLGFILTTEQLREAERLIIDEDLRRLATQEQLEILKPSSEKRHG